MQIKRKKKVEISYCNWQATQNREALDGCVAGGNIYCVQRRLLVEEIKRLDYGQLLDMKHREKRNR